MGVMRLVTILFKNRISSKEIPYFRGCMIHYFGENSLFHNHESGGFHYSYPLIQYKLIEGYAAIVGINEGCEAVKGLVERKSFDCHLGNRKVIMEVEAIRSEMQMLESGDTLNNYQINRWLPLNSENYRKFQQTDRLVDRIDMLEKILIGNILSFAKGVGIYFDTPVLCEISKLESVGVFRYKDVDLVNFFAEFRSNVTLPDFVGLGKSVSINNGVIARI